MMKQAAGCRSFIFRTQKTRLISSTFISPSYLFLKSGGISISSASKSINFTCKNSLMWQKRFFFTVNPLNPYGSNPNFTSVSQLMEAQQRHLSWIPFRRTTKTESGEQFVTFELKFPRILLALAAAALLGLLSEYLDLHSDDEKKRKEAVSKLERARRAWASISDEQLISLALSTTFAGLIWGTLRSTLFLKWFPQFSVKTYTQLFSERMTRNFILRNMLVTPILGLVVAGTSLGSVYLAWTLFQPTEDEMETGIMTEPRKMEYIFKQLVSAGLFPLILGWAVVTIQPYVIVPAWIGGTFVFSLTVKRQSIPFEPTPTPQQIFDEIISVGKKQDPDPWQVVIDEETERRKKALEEQGLPTDYPWSD